MKLILTGALLGLSLLGSVLAQDHSKKASFIGYDSEFKSYSFETEDGDYLEFNVVKADLVKKFGLSDKAAKGKAFVVEYDIKESEDEDGDLVEEYILSKLTPTTIVKKEEEADEDF